MLRNGQGAIRQIASAVVVTVHHPTLRPAAPAHTSCPSAICFILAEAFGLLRRILHHLLQATPVPRRLRELVAMLLELARAEQ
jgi:hypothetical protein